MSKGNRKKKRRRQQAAARAAAQKKHAQAAAKPSEPEQGLAENSFSTLERDIEPVEQSVKSQESEAKAEASSKDASVPFPVSWTVKMKKKQKETQDILSYHTQAAGCSDKARAKASGGRQPIEECGRTGL